ncbi:MAG: helix-turn-helix domain-containing protein [Candidatus Thiodiazotropha sp. (ex Epidulcina cf. delphinae)]|nr:helix-turn-helix domain-containing protein [Candidatus Thiodiazotropha sp. (ex Epidulcina cf. delphinae)]
MGMKKSSIDSLRENLNMLRRETGMSIADISKKGGAKTRSIYSILDGGRGATVDMADKIAASFCLQGWQLTIPNLRYDIVKSGNLDKLIDCYIKADEQSRKLILNLVERVVELEAGRPDLLDAKDLHSQEPPPPIEPPNKKQKTTRYQKKKVRK